MVQVVGENVGRTLGLVFYNGQHDESKEDACGRPMNGLNDFIGMSDEFVV